MWFIGRTSLGAREPIYGVIILQDTTLSKWKIPFKVVLLGKCDLIFMMKINEFDSFIF